ncbi:YdcF family protein [Rhodobacter sp. SGA-6-6]|uniref:YdcF family protein n=1 Tax=Rhodobacter sp. SGA-6-6 TaxID=2710882 RepID=UPI0013ECF386|nr:YdcF family protein [Rhodobacter sp. SGA-6-6]NGM44064.1 YdcF family protein [Rhodobacter sp. SGA-6-6]
MDSLFFIASKTLGMAARAETWIVLLLALALLAGAAGRIRAMRRLVAVVFVALLALTVFPLGTPILGALEGQYPANPDLPAHVDGIIVLGGAEDTGSFARWGIPGLNEGGERMTAGVELARRYPEAKLIFTGGAASLVYSDASQTPSRMTRALWLSLGVPEAQILLEDRSRNTSENAIFTREMIAPQEGQVWILVTSAFHMPRSVETFRRNGWTGLIPYPVDFRSGGQTFRAEWRLDDHLQDVDVALKEYLGLLAYRMAGK